LGGNKLILDTKLHFGKLASAGARKSRGGDEAGFPAGLSVGEGAEKKSDEGGEGDLILKKGKNPRDLPHLVRLRKVGR
jgi:hypothetical protein